jgi:hypothetical protein
LLAVAAVAPFAKIFFLTVLMHSMLYSECDTPLFCVMWLLLAISFHFILSFAIYFVGRMTLFSFHDQLDSDK